MDVLDPRLRAAMITHVYVSNYGSIGAGLELTLGALTALVGPPGSGKGCLLDAVRFLAECASGALDQAASSRRSGALQRPRRDGALTTLGVAVSRTEGHGFWLVQIEPGERDGEIRVKSETAAWWQRSALTRLVKPGVRDVFDAGSDSPEVSFDRLKGSPKGFSRKDKGRSGTLAYRGVAPIAVSGARLVLPLLSDGPLTPMLDELRRAVLYSLAPRTLRAPQKLSASRRLRASGDNWGSVLRALEKERWKDDFLAGLSQVIGDVDGARAVSSGGLLVPELRHGVDGDGRERWRAAADEPDATLRLAAIVTALSQEPPLVLAGFEHPDAGLDRGALPALLEHLRGASAQRHILLTTESPALLDLLPLDAVYAVELRDGSTTASRVDEPQRRALREQLAAPESQRAGAARAEHARGAS
ncbi:AAA family ATPase [Sorangium sp. So ce233]|uniref:AAA family ATPase n=1 Tax=Sorangium sp. So ce233 TaxID=3133290 RepID=UPI003F616E87